MQYGRRPHLEERVGQPLFGHVERHLGFEHPLIERQQAIHVLGQEGEMVNALDELHRRRVLEDWIRPDKRPLASER
jgi:hypothetical protein